MFSLPPPHLRSVTPAMMQERGETVSGGWDPEVGGRRTVRLPALAPEQARRPEYLYPTADEVQGRVEKLRERRRRLDAKRAKALEVKNVLLPDAKEEYANVLEDTRHPANKEAYSAEDLRRARDEARAEVDRCASRPALGVCCLVWCAMDIDMYSLKDCRA